MVATMIRKTITIILLAIPAVAFTSEPALEHELARLGEMSGGTMGVGVVHLESGRNAWLNPDDRFPTAESLKRAIRQSTSAAKPR